jgi:DNA polymerase III delta prime subunit
MDAFLEGDFGETEVKSTPNIEFQLDKYNEKEYISKKQIPEEALFVPYVFLTKLKKFFQGNLDIPLLIYGLKGCGKLTTVLGLINHFPGYLQDIENIYDARKINNLYYMKILDREYEKLLVYENLYYLNIDILSNTTEIGLYLKHIYKIGKNRSIDGGKKVIIIAHIEKCNTEAQKYINFILDKLNANTSYIFTTTKLNNLEYKIKSSCARINFGYLDEKEFSRIFTFNYNTTNNTTSGSFESKHFLPAYIKNYYQIYVNNHYNIGNTISQIKYIIETQDITLEKLKTDEYRQSLMHNIVKNFIKKKLKLSTVNSALEIRKFLYTLLSLNIDLLEFSKYLTKQLLASKINDNSKALIINKAGELSYEFKKINKEVISVESFIYDIIHIIYTGGKPE